MIAVLLDSRRTGESSWAAVRGQGWLRVRGMKEGDVVMVSFRPGMEGVDIVHMEILADADIVVPGVAEAVKAAHIQTSGSKVSVDLVKHGKSDEERVSVGS